MASRPHGFPRSHRQSAGGGGSGGILFLPRCRLLHDRLIVLGCGAGADPHPYGRLRHANVPGAEFRVVLQPVRKRA